MHSARALAAGGRRRKRAGEGRFLGEHGTGDRWERGRRKVMERAPYSGFCCGLRLGSAAVGSSGHVTCNQLTAKHAVVSVWHGIPYTTIGYASLVSASCTLEDAHVCISTRRSRLDTRPGEGPFSRFGTACTGTGVGKGVPSTGIMSASTLVGRCRARVPIGVAGAPRLGHERTRLPEPGERPWAEPGQPPGLPESRRRSYQPLAAWPWIFNMRCASVPWKVAPHVPCTQLAV